MINKQKTPISCIWQLRLFGRDFIWGYINIAEAADLGEDNSNIVLSHPTKKEKE